MFDVDDTGLESCFELVLLDLESKCWGGFLNEFAEGDIFERLED